ncbi:MAG: hypothetical protein EAZ88_19205 [Oscillatoriales cyanobacterium]|nr:MAG: hypothetical protein EAZ88_19205 [Oscillatoriales cyanobacterium]TAG73586.1 MAG: hypothetical protein EAZ23_09550 [Oscillatoriales cyanobacterium]
MFEVFPKSVKDGNKNLPHYLRRPAPGLPTIGVMGEAVAVRAIAAIRLRVSPVCVRKQGKQPQNWRALAVNRSGHLMRKYRLTYHQKNG